MKIINNILGILLASIAMIMALGSIYLLLLSPYSFVFYIFMAIIIWELTPESWGTIGWSCVLITACLYLALMFITSLCWQPLRYLMSILLSVCSTLLLLKGKPIWIWIIIFIVYLSVVCYCFFYNDIVGPMGFMIRDRPIDVPSQWYHCYRFFWTGVFLNRVTSVAGIISVLILILYNIKVLWEEIK